MRTAHNESGPRKPIEILLVEDNAGDVRLLKEAFKECRFEAKLSLARDGDQALQFLRQQKPFENSRRPELILLDLNLPRKGGREVLAEVKKDSSLRQIPIMILSTSTRPEDIESAYDLHANCYIPKPSDIAGLIEVASAIDAFWLKTAALAGAVSSRPRRSAARRTS